MTINNTEIQVSVNDKPMTCPSALSLSALLVLLDMPLQATAVAVNEDIVPRHQWDSTLLSSGDRIALFQAIAGG
ncbi:sulfur carrier protein ThiS [Photobacterium kagoshimensis]|uniref:sulfur carrier protein ThiS n=1 Tax=Photobacterium kagoshimensis TaxID=2910242 RepID=UPI003D0B9597